MDREKMSKIPYMILQFDKDGNTVHEESHNMENIYLDPYAIEGIARSILPDIQAYFQTEEGQAARASLHARPHLIPPSTLSRQKGGPP